MPYFSIANIITLVISYVPLYIRNNITFDVLISSIRITKCSSVSFRKEHLHPIKLVTDDTEQHSRSESRSDPLSAGFQYRHPTINELILTVELEVEEVMSSNFLTSSIWKLRDMLLENSLDHPVNLNVLSFNQLMLLILETEQWCWFQTGLDWGRSGVYIYISSPMDLEPLKFLCTVFVNDKQGH
jgi:hypothetical protein